MQDEVKNILGWITTAIAFVVNHIESFNQLVSLAIGILSIGFLVTKWYYLFKNKGKQ